MERYREEIWQRSLPAWVTMRDARMRFVNDRDYIALASAHWSLVGRYLTGWQRVFALWHVWRATWNINTAMGRMGDTDFSADQIDVISTILGKAPHWLGGDRAFANSLLISALYMETDEKVKPHTRALMFTTLGEIQWSIGSKQAAIKSYEEARHLLDEIETENSEDREFQLMRVLKRVGLFYYDSNPDNLKRNDGVVLLKRALSLTRTGRTPSRDQEEKLLTECWRRGLRLDK